MVKSKGALHLTEKGSEIWDSGRARVGWPDYPSHANVLPPLLGPSQAWGLSTGHSCFPFLLNHTAAIWTRLSLHNVAELLHRPRLGLSRQAWPSEPRPLPSAPMPDPLGPSSLLPSLLRGPADSSGPGSATC